MRGKSEKFKVRDDGFPTAHAIIIDSFKRA
jgi:hypothetical protein